jgi:hypothetical protein
VLVPSVEIPLALLLLAWPAAVAQQPVPASHTSLPATDPAGLPQRARSVHRHGITWTFAAEHVVGTYCNGDPWVVGPVSITGIEPRCVEVDGRVVHGSMVDPDPSSMLQGYDSRLFGDEKRERYRAELNVAWNLSPEQTLELAPVHSLVSVISRDDAKQMTQLQGAAVLTIVGAPPAPDAFRPPYVRGDKGKEHRLVAIDTASLPREKPTADAPPLAEVAAGFERLWLDHFPNWPVRHAHPSDNMPDYGRDMAAAVGSGGLWLCLDAPAAQKRELMIRMVQMGIDLHGCVRGGGRFAGLGGHGSGRKFPILLAGHLLQDAAMLAVGVDFPSARTSAASGNQYFAEDGQTFYVRETSPGVYNWGFGGYTKDHVGLAEWGFAHADSPDQDRAGWDDNPYRRCCTANGWVGQTLAARMLGLQQAWAHPAFFDYMDRYMKVQPAEAWHRAWAPWHGTMWDAHRSRF